mgnify:CR=1 FL=1
MRIIFLLPTLLRLTSMAHTAARATITVARCLREWLPFTAAHMTVVACRSPAFMARLHCCVHDHHDSMLLA